MPVFLAAWEADIHRITVKGQPWQKVCKPHLNGKNWMWWHTSVIPATVRNIK
jgi:hypothetical protein